MSPCEGSRESFQNIISSVEIYEQHKSMTTAQRVIAVSCVCVCVYLSDASNRAR